MIKLKKSTLFTTKIDFIVVPDVSKFIHSISNIE